MNFNYRFLLKCVFVFFVLNIFNSCNIDTRDDITIILGFIEAQDYNGYNEFINGQIEPPSGQNQLKTVKCLFKNSSQYDNSEFSHIDSLILEKYYVRALSKIDSLLEKYKDAPNEDEIIVKHIEYLKSDVLMRTNQFENFIEFNKEYDIDYLKENKDVIQQLYFLKINLLRADYLIESASYEEAKAYIYLGLFLFENQGLNQFFPRLYIQYCNEIAISLRYDDRRNAANKAIYYYKHALKIAQKNTFKDWENLLFANLEDAYYSIEDSISGLYYQNQAVNLDFDAEYLLMLGNRSVEDSLYDDAFYYYKKGLESLNSNSDELTKIQLYAFTADLLGLEGKFDSAQMYLDLAWDMKNYSPFIKEEGAYEIHLIEFDYLKALDSNYQKPISEIIYPLLERRRKGYTVIRGSDSQHLSDFLVGNTIRYLDYINERLGTQNIPLELQYQLLALIADAKRNKSNLRTAKANAQKIIAKEIAFLNQQLDKMPLNGKHLDSVYFKLSHAYEKLDKSELGIIASQPLDSEKFTDAKIVNFLYDEINYFMYLKQGHDLQLFKFPADSINLYVNSILAMVENNDDRLTKACSDFRNFLNLDDLQESQLNLLPDGDLIGFPFSLLFENQDIDIYYNYSLLNSNIKSSEINSQKPVTILSYTDLETNNNLEEKMKYRELLEGYKECSFIKDSIFENAVFISGKDFNIGTLENNLDTEIWHISSHALSDTSSQYNVSILLRDDDGRAVPYYGYELLKFEMPKFVFLNACKTGIGQIEVGEGVYSFSKYCQLAGSETVINTLWDVGEEKAAKFSKEFYRNWKSGFSALESFTAAINLLKLQHPDPSSWAPFVLEGNPNVYLSQN